MGTPLGFIDLLAVAPAVQGRGGPEKSGREEQRSRDEAGHPARHVQIEAGPPEPVGRERPLLHEKREV
ncbi:MAG: hypothetical protein AAB263_19015, partial [Planctomycetota bacterium]